MTFYYLASPYSKYPGGLDSAFRIAAQQTALLVRHGIPVFSPIVHSHPVAQVSALDPRDLNIWLPADKPFMDAAKGIIVLHMTGWQDSEGVAHEIATFGYAGKPIIHMEPGKVPAELLGSAE